MHRLVVFYHTYDCKFCRHPKKLSLVKPSQQQKVLTEGLHLPTLPDADQEHVSPPLTASTPKALAAAHRYRCVFQFCIFSNANCYRHTDYCAQTITLLLLLSCATLMQLLTSQLLHTLSVTHI